MRRTVVTVTLAALILGGWSMYQAFALDRPLQEVDIAPSEIDELKQQVTQLLGRIDRLEAELDEVAQVATNIGYTFARPFPDAASDDKSEHVEFIRQGGTDEGMMIDAIEHSQQWLW